MWRLGFFLLGFLSAALASPFLSQKDCTKGPEVWCQNLQTASHCKAIKHCRQTVWNKPTLKSIPCDLCKEIVTIAGKVLKDNATEEEIHAYMSKACELVPDQSLVAQCKEIVDEYLPNIMDMIKEELDKPEVVCSSLSLCQSLQKHLAAMNLQKQLQSNRIPELDFSELASPFMANVPLLLYPQDKPKQETQGNGDVCQDCVKLIADIQEAVSSNASFVESLIEHIKEQCDLLGPAMADQCKGYVSEYSDLAIQMFIHMQPKECCSMIGLCSSRKSVPLQTLVPAKAIYEIKREATENSASRAESLSLCVVCKDLVEEVASLLENNKTETEIAYEMEKICSVFPKTIKEQCRDFVEVYGKAMIDMLLTATDPSKVCEMLKCCTKQALYTEKNTTPVQSRIGDFCDLCKLIVSYADKKLAKNATSAEIKDFLDKICHILPEQEYAEQCIKFVDNYEPMIVELLAELMDPTFVCTKLGVCLASTQPLLGSEECVWGPGYWCKNMDTASQCNAVEHCRRHVWN